MSNKQGVYAMWDESNGLVKLGKVDVHGTEEARADHLHLELLHCVSVKNSNSSESKLHARYEEFHVPPKEVVGMTEGKTEMYRITKEEGIYAIKTLTGEHNIMGLSPFAERFLSDLENKNSTEWPVNKLVRDQYGRGRDHHSSKIDNLMAEIERDGCVKKPLIVARIGLEDTVLSGNHRHICATSLKNIIRVPVIFANDPHLIEKDLRDIAVIANRDNSAEIPISEEDIHSLLRKDRDRIMEFYDCDDVEAWQKIYDISTEYDRMYNRKKWTVKQILAQNLMKKARQEKELEKDNWKILTAEDREDVRNSFPREEGVHYQLESFGNWQQGMGYCIHYLINRDFDKAVMYIHKKKRSDNIEVMEKTLKELRRSGYNIEYVAVDQNRKNKLD